MKNLLFILGLLSIGLFASCGGGAAEAECCGADGECCKEGATTTKVTLPNKFRYFLYKSPYRFTVRAFFVGYFACLPVNLYK